jgi:hypothetical protein
MRKGESDGKTATTKLSIEALQTLEDKGYRFVQVIGLTLDKHYDYVEPHFLILIPMKELPTDQSKKGIYEPIGSDLLKQWAVDSNSSTDVFISKNI